MKKSTVMKSIEITSLAVIGFVALFLLFCEPNDEQSVVGFLWSLIWTKALGILLVAIIVGRLEMRTHDAR